MPTFTSRTVATAALVVSVGCAPSAEREGAGIVDQPLIGGAETDSDPAVVAIVHASDPSRVRCSATLIAERVVLTAAHCGVQLDPNAFRVTFGATVGKGVAVPILEALAHPGYDATATHDLALLLLGEKPPAAPARLLDGPVVAAPPPVALRLVGFGALDTKGTIDGKKREGVSKTSAVADTFITLEGDPALPCNGDSGGPVFAAAASGEGLAAVVSRGDAECSSYAKATRVDVHLASFIQPFVVANKPGAAAEGQRCRYDEHCATGLCLAATDDPRLRFCSRACGRDAECLAPMTCESALCRYPAPSPGALGGACTSDRTCLDGDCLPRGACSRRCVTGRGDCPSGFSCEYLGGIDFYCIAAAKPSARVFAGGGGCATGGSGTASVLWLLAPFIAARARRKPSGARPRPEASRT